jgi:hypothetical protein
VIEVAIAARQRTDRSARPVTFGVAVAMWVAAQPVPSGCARAFCPTEKLVSYLVDSALSGREGGTVACSPVFVLYSNATSLARVMRFTGFWTWLRLRVAIWSYRRCYCPDSRAPSRGAC